MPRGRLWLWIELATGTQPVVVEDLYKWMFIAGKIIELNRGCSMAMRVYYPECLVQEPVIPSGKST